MGRTQEKNQAAYEAEAAEAAAHVADGWSPAEAAGIAAVSAAALALERAGWTIGDADGRDPEDGIVAVSPAGVGVEIRP